MGFEEALIYLDNDDAAYYTGQTLNGRLVFNQEKTRDISGIHISFKGYCKVHWTTTRKRGKHSETVHHTSYEEYFNRTLHVFGDENGEHQLLPGPYEFNFNFDLPIGIPSSFEGGLGHIRHRVKAVMVTSGVVSLKKEVRVNLKVFVPVNLNANPACREPLELFVKNSYCRCGLSIGSSQVQVKLPVGGYCPGQTVRAEVHISNLSGVDIDDIEFMIRRTIRFEAVDNPDVSFDKSTVFNYNKGPVEAGTVPQWTLDLPIPPSDVYNFDTCKYIQISYKFKVLVYTRGCHENGKEGVHILFGSIPLVGIQDNMQNAMTDQITNNNPVLNMPSSSYQASPPIMPPGPGSSTGNQSYPYPGNQPYPHPREPYPNPGNQANPKKENLPYPHQGMKPEEYQPRLSSAPGYPNIDPTLPPPYPGLHSNVIDPENVNAENLGFMVAGDGPDTPLLTPGTNPADTQLTQSTPYVAPSAPKL